jgi:hypothetical protein
MAGADFGDDSELAPCPPWLATPNCAHLVVSAPETAEVGIDLRADGDPVSAGCTHFGPDAIHHQLDGSLLTVAQLVGLGDALVRAGESDDLAVYVWYEPCGEGVAVEDLEPEVREGLEALGYLD